MSQLSGPLDDFRRRNRDAQQHRDAEAAQAKAAAEEYFSRFVAQVLPQLFVHLRRFIASGADFVPLQFTAERHMDPAVRESRLARTSKPLLQQLFPCFFGPAPPGSLTGCYVERADYLYGSSNSHLMAPQFTDFIWIVYEDQYAVWWQMAERAVSDALAAEDSRIRLNSVDTRDRFGGRFHVSWA